MFQPAGQVAESDLLDLRVRERLAFDAMSTWQGSRCDLRALMVSAATARELAALGYGADELPNIALADIALAQAKTLAPGSIGVPAGQLQTVRWLLLFLDAQRAAASRRHFHQALGRVRREPSRYGIPA